MSILQCFSLSSTFLEPFEARPRLQKLNVIAHLRVILFAEIKMGKIVVVFLMKVVQEGHLVS